MKFNNLEKLPCECGGEKEQIIGYDHRETDDTYVPVRKGWYCFSCFTWERAVLRERIVDENHR